MHARQTRPDTHLPQLLGPRYDLVSTRAEKQIEAGSCSAEQTGLLAIPAGSPVLRNRRTTYNQHDRAFEHTESVYRGGWRTFRVELTI